MRESVNGPAGHAGRWATIMQLDRWLFDARSLSRERPQYFSTPEQFARGPSKPPPNSQRNQACRTAEPGVWKVKSGSPSARNRREEVF